MVSRDYRGYANRIGRGRVTERGGGGLEVGADLRGAGYEFSTRQGEDVLRRPFSPRATPGLTLERLAEHGPRLLKHGPGRDTAPKLHHDAGDRFALTLPPASLAWHRPVCRPIGPLTSAATRATPVVAVARRARAVS